MIDTVMGRWRIERDDQELKQELGLGHYKGRNWRRFHHHANLCLAPHGFLMLERLTRGNAVRSKTPPCPPASSRAGRAPMQRYESTSIATCR